MRNRTNKDKIAVQWMNAKSAKEYELLKKKTTTRNYDDRKTESLRVRDIAC